MCGIALCGEADLVGLARTRVIFYLTPRRTDRRSLKILIARVEFFRCDRVESSEIVKSLIRGIAPSVPTTPNTILLDRNGSFGRLEHFWWAGDSFQTRIILNLLFLNFHLFCGRASVWIDPYQKPHQVSKVNSLWSIKDNVVKGSRQNRLVSSVEGLAL